MVVVVMALLCSTALFADSSGVGLEPSESVGVDMGQKIATQIYNYPLNSPAMEQARKALKKHHGGQNNFLVLGERFEQVITNEKPQYNWEAQAWYGGDLNKAWFKTEGEYSAAESAIEEAELQFLYSRAISAFWDVQTGVRQDFKPHPSRTYGVIGVQGLAPHWFEVDAALFVSNKGDVSSRLEAEYELRITQRLIFQPRLELNTAFSEDAEIGSGTGVNDLDIGVRLRYEFSRQFAPYIGVGWRRLFSDTADLAETSREDSDRFSLLLGVRMWF